MPSGRSLSKSPLQVANLAFRLAQESLPAYFARRSRHDFTVAQHFALLVLKTFFQTDYRGIVRIVAEWSDLRQVLQLKKTPHFTTLQKAQARLSKKTLSSACSKLCSRMPSSAV